MFSYYLGKTDIPERCLWIHAPPTYQHTSRTKYIKQTKKRGWGEEPNILQLKKHTEDKKKERKPMHTWESGIGKKQLYKSMWIKELTNYSINRWDTTGFLDEG